jgi:hypothetical protein
MRGCARRSDRDWLGVSIPAGKPSVNRCYKSAPLSTMNACERLLVLYMSTCSTAENFAEWYRIQICRYQGMHQQAIEGGLRITPGSIDDVLPLPVRIQLP